MTVSVVTSTEQHVPEVGAVSASVVSGSSCELDACCGEIKNTSGLCPGP